MQETVAGANQVLIAYDVEKRQSSLFIVFLHGAGGDINAWNPIRGQLHSQGFSTIAIDLRGHGLSGRPQRQNDYLLDLFSEDVHQVLKAENVKRFILVGHCFGGIVAMNFHRRYPALASGYVLIDSTYHAPRTMERLYNGWAFNKLANRLERAGEGTQDYSRRDFHEFVGTGNWSLRRIGSDIKSTSLRSWLFSLKQLASFKGEPVLQGMQQPVLIIHGRKDSVVSPKVAERMNAIIKGSELKLIEGENHIIVINNPDAVAKEILAFAVRLQEKPAKLSAKRIHHR